MELRSFYQNTLMMALRQENTRRHMVPRQAIAQQPELGRPDPDRGPREQRRGAQPEKISPRGSLLGPGQPAVLVPDPGDPGGADQGGGPDEHAVAAGSVEIDRVLMAPADYREKTLSITGVFKVGTRISEVQDSKGRVVGFSIPVSRNDGRTICTADGKAEGHDLYMILDAPIAQILSRVFTELELEPTIKPTYRTVLEISVQESPNAHGPDQMWQSLPWRSWECAITFRSPAISMMRRFAWSRCLRAEAGLDLAMAPSGSKDWVVKRSMFSRSAANSANCKGALPRTHGRRYSRVSTMAVS